MSFCTNLVELREWFVTIG